MRYDYPGFLKSRIKELETDPLFAKCVEGFVKEDKLNKVIQSIDIKNGTINLKTDSANNYRVIKPHQDLAIIESNVKLRSKEPKLQSAIEIIYKKDKINYSYTEFLEGPRGAIITATEAEIHNRQYNGIEVIVPDNIKMGLWAYDIKTLELMLEKKIIPLVLDKTIASTNLNCFDSYLELQNRLHQGYYILPDMFFLAYANLIAGLNYDCRRISDILGMEYKEKRSLPDENYKESLRKLKSLITAYSDPNKLEQITGITKEEQKYFRFDAIDFYEEQEEKAKEFAKK